MELRAYQKEAIEAVQAEWAKGVLRTLLVLPTGTGKTICFSKIIEEQVRKGERCLILAHRYELLEQASDKLQKASGLHSAIEKAENSALGAWERVTVGSIQSLSQTKRLNQFPPDYYQTIVVDEAHHALSPSYRKVLDYFKEAKVLGVTATADRGDGKNLGEYFQSKAYEYTMPNAIKDGFLVPISALQIPINIDISHVKQSQGDFQLGELGHAIDPYLEAIADEIKKYCMERKTVVFLPLVDTSKRFCKILNSKGLSAREVNGNSDDRKEVLEDFNAGKFHVLCNAMLLTEGWDCPSVDTIVVLRPTKVRSLYTQMIGRGTRICDGKKSLLLLDFLWLTNEHSLCHPSVLISSDKEVQEKVQKIMEENPEKEFGLEEVVNQAEEDVVENREKSLAAKLNAYKTRKKRLVDPMAYAFSTRKINLVNYEPTYKWEFSTPSEKQMKELEDLDIDPMSIKNAGQAELLIRTVKERQKLYLATPKQIRLLEQKGFKHVGTWTKREATQMISKIQFAGWKVPKGIIPSQYKPERSETV